MRAKRRGTAQIVTKPEEGGDLARGKISSGNTQRCCLRRRCGCETALEVMLAAAVASAVASCRPSPAARACAGSSPIPLPAHSIEQSILNLPNLLGKHSADHHKPAMAPDLNSVPPSPRLPQATATATHPSAPAPSNGSSHQTPPASTSHPSSRRASQLSSMNPPPLPLGAAAANGSAPTSQPQSQATYQPFPPLSPHLPGTAPRGSLDEAGVPMRHPRPLTAAELHHELELEQEAVVRIVRPFPSLLRLPIPALLSP